MMSIAAAPLRFAEARSPEEVESAADAAGVDEEAEEAEEAEEGAGADTPAAPEDRVDLRSGGMVQGRLVEVLPGESLTIASESGEQRTFAWDEVARYTRDGAWVVVDAPEPAPTRRRSSGYGPTLHIETTRPAPVSLYEITSEAVASGGNVVVHAINYRAVCSAPCDDEVDASAGRPFFFGGPGLTPSRRFTLSSGGHVTAKVKPGRKWMWNTGMVGLGLGLTAAAGGGAWLAVRKSEANNQDLDPMNDPLPAKEPSLAGPTALLVGGVALLVGGVVMMIVGKTRAKLSGG